MSNIVMLDDVWSASIVLAQKHSFISLIKLENVLTGRVVEYTRFDRGKLIFLDLKDEFPTFSYEKLLALAVKLHEHVN